MELSEITLNNISGGLNTREPQERIEDNQSPDMLNLWFRDKALVKRPGQQMLIKNLKGNLHEISDEYKGYRIIHAGGKFYRWDEAGAKIYKGEYDPAELTGNKSPLSLFGDYYSASKKGITGDTYYQESDIAIAGAQTVTAEVMGTVVSSGSVTVVVTMSETEGSPFMFNVALTKGNTAAQAAAKIRTVLSGEEALTNIYIVGGDKTKIMLTRIKPDVYDNTLNIHIHKGTSKGVEQKGGSVKGSIWHNAITEIGVKTDTETVADKEGVFVLFGDMLYHMDGNEIWKIYQDNGEWIYEAVQPYEPVVMINCTPDLSDSTDFEAYNLLGGGFTVKYNGDAGGNVYYYIATIPSPNTFTITDINGSTAPITVTPVDQGWKIRKKEGDWLSGGNVSNFTVNNVTTSVFTLNSHAFSPGDAIQFDPGTGSLPSGLEAWNSDAVKVYKLPVKELDSMQTANIKVVINDDDIHSGYAASVDEDGKIQVTFDSAPPAGINNVWITAYKTNEGYRERITGCKATVTFGGEAGGVAGGTRVFVMCNTEYPQCYWHSDIGQNIGNGMSYFPVTGEEILDQTCGKITAMAKMGEELVIFKDTSIFAVKYSYDGKDVYFPVRECNGFVGCDIPGSVQLIDNRLIFANTRSGVNMLISTNNELENLVKPLSANVNNLLLAETGIKEACSCDHDRHYWICANGNVYLWDYGRTPYYNYSDYDEAQKKLSWYRWNGIKARMFFTGNALYYGFEDGIAQFVSARNDFGGKYDAYFKSKAFDLGNPQKLKTFMYIYPSFISDGIASVRVSAGNENNDEYMTRDFKIKSFGWSDFNWDEVTLNIYKYAKTFAVRLAMKKASYIQIKVSGMEENRGIGLKGLRITFFVNKKMKEK